MASRCIWMATGYARASSELAEQMDDGADGEVGAAHELLGGEAEAAGDDSRRRARSRWILTSLVLAVGALAFAARPRSIGIATLSPPIPEAVPPGPEATPQLGLPHASEFFGLSDDEFRQTLSNEDFQNFLNASIAFAVADSPELGDHETIFRTLMQNTGSSAGGPRLGSHEHITAFEALMQKTESTAGLPTAPPYPTVPPPPTVTPVPPLHSPASHKIANDLYCYIDVTQAIQSIIYGVVYLYYGVDTTPGEPVELNTAVNILIGTWSWWAAVVHILLGVSNCPNKVNMKAACAADIMLIIADVADIATNGMALVSVCDNTTNPPSLPPFLIEQKKKLAEATEVKKFGEKKKPQKHGETITEKLAQLRLPELLTKAQRAKKRGVKKETKSPKLQWPKLLDDMQKRKLDRTTLNYRYAACSADVLTAGSYLLKAGLFAAAAVNGCPDPTCCAMSVLDIAAFVAWGTSFLSAAASDCGPSFATNQAAICGETVAGLVGTVANLGGTLAIVPQVCKAALDDTTTPEFFSHPFGWR